MKLRRINGHDAVADMLGQDHVDESVGRFGGQSRTKIVEAENQDLGGEERDDLEG